jgi:hypothetical protein
VTDAMDIIGPDQFFNQKPIIEINITKE